MSSLYTCMLNQTQSLLLSYGHQLFVMFDDCIIFVYLLGNVLNWL